MKPLSILLGLLLIATIIFQFSQKPTQATYQENNSGFVLVQDNTLVGISTPNNLVFKSYGIVISEENLTSEQVYLLKDLAFCESSLNPNAYNPRDPVTASIGLFQYKKTTWNYYCNGDIWNAQNQIDCASYMIFELGIGRQHWVNCWRIMGLDKYDIAFR